jgi:hypothetical protein
MCPTDQTNEYTHKLLVFWEMRGQVGAADEDVADQPAAIDGKGIAQNDRLAEDQAGQFVSGLQRTLSPNLWGIVPDRAYAVAGLAVPLPVRRDAEGISVNHLNDGPLCHSHRLASGTRDMTKPPR